MKKVFVGILLGLLLCPFKSMAYSPQQAIEIEYTDAQWLLKTAQAEAGNQGMTGQWLVMCVILNRVESEDFPDTVYEVISQPGQFSTYASGAIDNAEPTSDTHEALAYLEMGNKAEKIIAFENAKYNSLEKYFWKAFSVKDHIFYTAKQ